MLLNGTGVQNVFEEVAATEDGDHLPILAVAENAGINLYEARQWAVRMAQQRFRSREAECSEAEDAEILLLVAVDLFVSGLAVGLSA